MARRPGRPARPAGRARLAVRTAASGTAVTALCAAASRHLPVTSTWAEAVPDSMVWYPESPCLPRTGRPITDDRRRAARLRRRGRRGHGRRRVPWLAGRPGPRRLAAVRAPPRDDGGAGGGVAPVGGRAGRRRLAGADLAEGVRRPGALHPGR